MSYEGAYQIDDTLTFSVTTHNASTGALTDADSVPSYRVYEDETGTAILTGSMAKLDDANTTGFYSEQLTLSAANGFEVGKSYNIYISAAVSSTTGATTRKFQIGAAAPDVNVTQWNGSAVATPTTAGVPEVDITHIGGSAVSTSAAQLGVNVVNIEGSDATDQINAACDAAIETYNLHYILHTALPTNWATDITANSALDYMADDGTVAYDRTTDSLQAIADSGGGGPTAAQIADAVWDEAQADHVSAGSFGVIATEIADILTDTGTTIPGTITTLQATADAIEADTQDLQTQIGTAGAGLTDLGGMSTAMKAEVNAEVDSALDTAIPGVPTAGSVNDVLSDLSAALPASGTLLDDTTTYAEPSSIPAATASLPAKIGLITAIARNKQTQTATTYTLRNSADSANIGTAGVSDDGTTFTKNGLA